MRVESGLVVSGGSGKSGLKEGDVKRVRTSEPSWVSSYADCCSGCVFMIDCQVFSKGR